MTEVKVRRVRFGIEHEDQKWFVLEGYIDGVPQVTKRDTINVAAIVSGDVVLQDRIDKMKSDVTEFYANLQMLESLPSELE